MSDAANDDGAGLLPEFRDVPTSREHGSYICWFDVMLWVSRELTASAGLAE